MAITNKDCFNVQQILDGLARARGDKASMRTKLMIRAMMRLIDERRQDVTAEIAQLHDEYALRGEDGEFVFEDEHNTRLRIQSDRRAEFNNRYQELMLLEWEDAPTLKASVMDREFALDFETIWLLGDFLEDDMLEDPKDKAEAKRIDRRKKRASVNGASKEMVEA